MPVIVGSYSSESTMAIIPAVTQRQVRLIIPIAVADILLDSKSPWIFRVGASTTDYARATVAFLKDNGGPKAMAIVYENTNFGQSSLKAMTAVAQVAGIKLDGMESYQAKSPHYPARLQLRQ